MSETRGSLPALKVPRVADGSELRESLVAPSDDLEAGDRGEATDRGIQQYNSGSLDWSLTALAGVDNGNGNRTYSAVAAGVLEVEVANRLFCVEAATLCSSVDLLPELDSAGSVYYSPRSVRVF